MKITSGSLLIATGAIHLAIGLVETRHELGAMWREGLFDSVRPELPLRMAACWFLFGGLAMMALGALYRRWEHEVPRPLPFAAGVWLLAIGLFVVVSMPRSGAWFVLPQALLIMLRARHETTPEVSAALGGLLDRANVVDVKTIHTTKPLRGFAANMLAYQPRWITALYYVRMAFVRLLGMRQQGLPRAANFTEETLPSAVGQAASFFTVRLASPAAWAADIDDKHLYAALAVVQGAQKSVLHVVTVVRYKHWTGPAYFNVIRPFHHLVVRAMMRAGAR